MALGRSRSRPKSGGTVGSRSERARSRCRRVRRALLVSCAAAQAALHERLALGTLQSLRLGVRVAALHLLRLAIGPRGGRARGTGRARAGARRGLRALLGETTLHERLALGAHQSLRLRIRTAGRHLFLLAVRLRSLSEGGLPGKAIYRSTSVAISCSGSAVYCLR